MRDLVGIGDLHLPFCDTAKLKKAIAFIEAKKPYAVVQVGDLYDFFGQSRFPHRLNLTPKEETYYAREMGEEFWALIGKKSPKTKRFQLLGNHDDRPKKRLIEKTPELDPFVKFESFWDFEGVETIYSSRDVLEIDGVSFTHGHRSKPGDLIAELDFTNVVCGHSHTGGVVYRRARNKIFWELNCGYLADPFDEALQYRPLSKFFKWTHGLGFIDDFGPRFIPIED